MGGENCPYCSAAHHALYLGHSDDGLDAATRYVWILSVPVLTRPHFAIRLQGPAVSEDPEDRYFGAALLVSDRQRR